MCAFLCLYSSALLLHWGIHDWSHPEWNLLLLFLVLAQVVGGHRTALSISVVVITLPFLLMKFPRQANHANLETLISTCICIGLAVYWLKPAVRPKLEATLPATARLLAAAIYFWAGFHKLNSDFFAPDVSCSVHLLEGLLADDLGLDWSIPLVVARILPYFTLFLELVVPFGLFYDRTRAVSVASLFVFHAPLSLAGIANFSGLMLAVLLIA